MAETNDPSGHTPRYSPEEVQAFLDKTDWTEYWRKVDEMYLKEVEEYRRARARSMQIDGGRVFLAA